MKAPEFIIPVDLGQAADFTAVGGLRRVPKPTGVEKELYSGASIEMTREYADTWALGYAHRFQLHTPYPEVVGRIVEMTTRIPGSWRVVVDATGVGRPVVDMMHEAGLNPVGIMITGGSGAPRQDSTTGFWNVPKRVLVSSAQVAMQKGRVKISPKLALCDVITREMLSFKMKISAAGNTSFEAWRDGAHDDLVLMLCMGLWWGHQTKTGWQKDSGPLSPIDRVNREAAKERFGLNEPVDDPLDAIW